MTIQLDPHYYQGKELVIETENPGKENVYIQSVSFNNEPLTNCWTDRNRLTEGGQLYFRMGNQPELSFGREVPPPSMSQSR